MNNKFKQLYALDKGSKEYQLLLNDIAKESMKYIDKCSVKWAMKTNQNIDDIKCIAFVAFMKAIESYRHKYNTHKWESYLTTVIRNKVVDEHRKTGCRTKGYKPMVYQQICNDDGNILPLTYKHEISITEEYDLDALIKNAQLNDIEKEVLEHYLNNITITEIGRKMGKCYTAILNIYETIKSKIRLSIDPSATVYKSMKLLTNDAIEHCGITPYEKEIAYQIREATDVEDKKKILKKYNINKSTLASLSYNIFIKIIDYTQAKIISEKY